jgi:hypothetical protein
MEMATADFWQERRRYEDLPYLKHQVAKALTNYEGSATVPLHCGA